jgi:hypothetical protein
MLSAMDELQTFLSVCVGIGLSAACGFRVFVPLLCLSIAAHTGNIPLDDKFAWVASTPALIALSVATVVEIGAYYLPFVDNLLDSIAVPLAGAAGVFVSGIAMTELDPFWRWGLAIIAGGGAATTTQLATTKLRAVSSTTTAGVANPVLSTFEAIMASIVSVLSIVWPIIAFILVAVLLVASWFLIYYAWKRIAKLVRARAPSGATASRC